MLRSVSDVPYLGLFWVTNGSPVQAVGFAQDWRVVGAESGAVPDGRLWEELRKRSIRYVVLHRSTDPQSDAWMRHYLHVSLGTPFYDDDSEGLTAWRLGEAPVDTGSTAP